jgi:hypothetical protein
MQLAMALALHTGQRQGDILRMAWSAYDGSAISLRQTIGGFAIFACGGVFDNVNPLKLREAITALTGARNTDIAHFDPQPNITGRRAIIRDLDHVISAASIIVGEANVFVLARRVDGPELRKMLRKDAKGFIATLRKVSKGGAATPSARWELLKGG